MNRQETVAALAQAFQEHRLDRRELVKRLAVLGLAAPISGAGLSSTLALLAQGQ
jgi:hypothetical protein